MITGFMNARTAEYALVPDIVRRLSSHFRATVPMFYWKSIEGQTKARTSSSDCVRITACYPRRPKVRTTGDSTVWMDVNAILSEQSQRFNAAGIPVFAGVPCVSRLSDFHPTVPCVWFSLDGHYERNAVHVEIDISLGTVVRSDSRRSNFLSPLHTSDIIEIVSKAPSVYWPDALDLIGRVWKEYESAVHFAGFLGPQIRYKPFFLASFEHNP